jgi:2-dehydro-3-deoxy-phosphogluconate aldolase
MKRLPLLNGKIAINLLAKNPENAKAVWEATEGHALVGVMLAEYPTVEGAIEQIRALQAVLPIVSVGMGAGDPKQWHRVVQASLPTDPGHINQVFPAAPYTLGALYARDILNSNVVNAMVTPSGTPGKVFLSTGPLSQAGTPAEVSCEAAAALMADVGVDSVKFFPIKGDTRLDEVRAMAKAAAEAGIPVFEPTGGILVKNVAKIALACFEAGSQVVIPHVYTAIVDPETGLTRPHEAAALLAELRRVVG